MLGYDFMVDEELKVWLIEVNSSPNIDYSTEVTSKLVQKGMYELGMVIHNYVMKGKKYQAGKAKTLYGGWQLVTPP